MRWIILLIAFTASAQNPLISRLQLVPMSNYLNSVWLQLSNVSYLMTNSPYSNIMSSASYTLTNKSLLAKNVPVQILTSDGTVLMSASFNSYEVSFPQVSSGELLFLSANVLTPSGITTDGAGNMVANGIGLNYVDASFTDGSFTNNETTGPAVIRIPNGSARTNWLNSALPAKTLQWVVDTGTAYGTNLYVKATSGTINGANTYIINVDHGAIAAQFDGANWRIVGGY